MAHIPIDPGGQEPDPTTLELRSRGRWPLPPGRPRVAILGAGRGAPYGRETPYGEAIAERIALELARENVVVVGGLSLGIEAAAHQAALEAGGCTVAVLGTGVDVVYPLPNVPLAERIVSSGGALLSPFPDGTQPRAANFQRRSWTIAALADLVVVVETTTASPVLVTVEAARSLGKPVMAVPGSVFSPFSVGCHQLLRDGAALVENGADVLAALPTGPTSPASLNQADIRAGWVQADCLRQDAHRRMLSAESQPGPALPRDFDGRTPAEAYHYWDGVVDAYAAMQRELQVREGRS
jgi:DNA protecting protein DprA